MKTWKVWLSIILIFVSGLSIGFIGGLQTAKMGAIRAFQKGPAGIQHIVLRRLTRQLDLSAEQQKGVDQILSSLQQQLTGIRDEQKPRISAILDTGFQQIRAQLNPDQQAKLDEMRARLRERWN